MEFTTYKITLDYEIELEKDATITEEEVKDLFLVELEEMTNLPLEYAIKLFLKVEKVNGGKDVTGKSN